jgi:hypothetical protein
MRQQKGSGTTLAQTKREETKNQRILGAGYLRL